MSVRLCSQRCGRSMFDGASRAGLFARVYPNQMSSVRIVGGHVYRTHRKVIQMVPHPGGHHRKLYRGEATEPQRYA